MNKSAYPEKILSFFEGKMALKIIYYFQKDTKMRRNNISEKKCTSI